MKPIDKDKVISVLPDPERQATPSQFKTTIENSHRIDDLMSLCSRPDALVLLPACVNALQPRRQTKIEAKSLDSTLQPIHKPISGYDHE